MVSGLIRINFYGTKKLYRYSGLMNQEKKIKDNIKMSNTSRIHIDPSMERSYDNKEGENERALFRAVIYQALLDASNDNELESKESIHVREEAVRWFSKSVGVTATWFIDICDLAGLNSQQVRTFALKLINDPDNTEFQRKRLNVLLNMTHKEET